MTFRLIREPSIHGTTLGVLFRDGHFFGYTCEDEIREVAGMPVSTWKIPRSTAIPAGRYAIQVTYSPRFNKKLPVLVGVPGFEGIRIHAGNTSEDTEGCICVGLGRDDPRQMVLRSAVGCQLLQDYMESAIAQGQRICIDIENPPQDRPCA